MIFNIFLKFPVNYNFFNPTYFKDKSTVQWTVSKTAIDHKHPNLIILETIYTLVDKDISRLEIFMGIYDASLNAIDDYIE